MTLPITATDVQIRFTAPAWDSDPARAELLEKTAGKHLLAAGFFGSNDVRVTIIGGPASDVDGDACRKAVLGDRLLGMGIATVAGFATAATIRELNPPYREFDRHAFVLGAGAMAHVQIVALEQGDPERFGDARFEALLASVRFAVLRRTDWDDMPEAYLELSNAAAARADGPAWLRERAQKPGASWITKLAAVEHAHAIRSTEDYVLELGGEVRAELLSKPERTHAEDAGLLLAEDGLAMALLRAGEIDAAQEHLEIAIALATRFSPRTIASIAASTACLRATKKDTDGVVAILTKAYEQDPSLRYRLQHEPLLEPVRGDARMAELLKVVLQMRSGRQLGH